MSKRKSEVYRDYFFHNMFVSHLKEKKHHLMEEMEDFLRIQTEYISFPLLCKMKGEYFFFLAIFGCLWVFGSIKRCQEENESRVSHFPKHTRNITPIQ